MSHISYTTLNHSDASSDFKALAPTRKEFKESISNSQARCAHCGLLPPQGTKKCSRCKIPQYCSKDCQVKDWPNHKKHCIGKEDDIPFKLAKKIRSIDYLLHLIQLYAIVTYDLNADNTQLDRCGLRITVATRPADTMAYIQAMINGTEDASKEVMLHFDKVEKIPLEGFLLDPMKVVLEERRKQLKGTPFEKDPLLSVLITSNNEHYMYLPIVMLPQSFVMARGGKIQVKSAMTGTTDLPMTEDTLIDAMNSFVRMDKKNQLGLRFTPK